MRRILNFGLRKAGFVVCFYAVKVTVTTEPLTSASVDAAKNTIQQKQYQRKSRPRGRNQNEAGRGAIPGAPHFSPTALFVRSFSVEVFLGSRASASSQSFVRRNKKNNLHLENVFCLQKRQSARKTYKYVTIVLWKRLSGCRGACTELY